MEELKELTPEQEALMPVVAKEYIDMFYSFKEIDRDAFESGIGWVYRDLLKKDIPNIVYLDSYKDMDTIVSEYGGKGDAVGGAVGGAVCDAVVGAVRDAVVDAVCDAVWGAVRGAVWDAVWDAVVGAVWGVIRDLSIKTFSSYYLSTYDNLYWIAHHDCFQRMGEEVPEVFNKYKSLILSGVFNTFEYENVVFAVQPPVKWVRDARGRPNNPHGYAIEWADGFGVHFIDGVRIEEGLFNKIKHSY